MIRRSPTVAKYWDNLFGESEVDQRNLESGFTKQESGYGVPGDRRITVYTVWHVLIPYSGTASQQIATSHWYWGRLQLCHYRDRVDWSLVLVMHLGGSPTLHIIYVMAVWLKWQVVWSSIRETNHHLSIILSHLQSTRPHPTQLAETWYCCQCPTNTNKTPLLNAPHWQYQGEQLQVGLCDGLS